MKINVEKADNCTRNLTIEIPAETVQEAFDAEYQRKRKGAQMAGYRKGKAPIGLIKRFYQGEVKEEVMKKMFSEYFSKALKESGLDPLTEPDLKDMELEENKPMKIEVTFEVIPEVTIEGYEGYVLTKSPVKLEESEVDEFIKTLQDRAAQMVAVPDRESRDGDYLIINVSGEIDGKKLEIDEDRDLTVLLGKDQFFPGSGFERHLMGLKRDDEKTIEEDFAADYQNESVAGKHAKITVQVKEIKEKQLPEIDDEFARDLGEYESLADLRTKVKEELLKDKERRAVDDLKEKILDHLIEVNSFDPPSSLVTQEFERLCELLAYQRGSRVDDISDEEKQEIQKTADKLVRKSVVLELVARQAELGSGEEQLDKHIAEIAEREGRSPEAVKAELERSDRIDHIKHRLQEDATLDYLLEKADITTQEGSEEEK